MYASIFLFCSTGLHFSAAPARGQCYEEQKLAASDAERNKHFGGSVSVSGDVAVVGASGDSCIAGSVCGSAYVYRYNGSTWVEQQKLTASDAAAGDSFGHSVSVSGDVAVVGAYTSDCAAGVWCGSAYVYHFDGTNWVEQQKLTASDADTYNFFGSSVSLSGDVAVVGADNTNCVAGPDCGSAYVYRYNGSTWVEQQKLTASDARANRRFGGSVSVSGDVAVVGESGSFYIRGSAYVYRYNGSTWVEQQKLTVSGAAANDRFGVSVSVSGEVAVVGVALADCAAGSDCGSAYVFSYNGSTWVEQQKLTASDAAAFDYFGASVSVSGDVTVVGAWRDDCAAGFDCGSAYVYRYNGSTWVEQQKLTASDAAANDDFGAPVSVSGDVAVVGAFNNDCAAGSDCGSAYVYTPRPDGQACPDGTFCNGAEVCHAGACVAGAYPCTDPELPRCDEFNDRCIPPIGGRVFVDANAQGANYGTTWADAYNDLQNALRDAAATPRDIWVAAGTYMADGGYTPTGGSHVPGSGARNATFHLLNGVAIYGGFAGGETSLSQRHIDANPTILSGDLNGNDAPVACTLNSPDCDASGRLCLDNFCIIKRNNAENSFHVITGSGTDPTAVLDGFTIASGNASGSSFSNDEGGGMYNSAGNPTVSNCTFSGNSAIYGGGIYFGGATNCAFSGNSASIGGGIYGGVATNCTFSGNSAGDGAGMYLGGATNCTFSGNSAGNNGGGMNYGGATNCTFSGNLASNNGGGMYSGGATNCTFSGNSASNNGGGMSHSSSTVTNCILWGNRDSGGMDGSAQIHSDGSTPVVSYSIVQGGWSGAGGIENSASDPLFVDADGRDDIAGTQDDDLRLSAGSPAIDAGNNVAVPADFADLDHDGNFLERTPLDLNGQARFVDDPDITDSGNGIAPIVDMGAFESFRDCNGNGIPDEDDLREAEQLRIFASGMSGPQDIVRSRGNYPPGFFVPDSNRCVVYHVSPDGTSTQVFSSGPCLDPIGATFVPDEFGGQGERLLVTVLSGTQLQIRWVKSDGTRVAVFGVNAQGVSGLVYIPSSVGGTAGGKLLVTAQCGVECHGSGSIHLVDAGGNATTIVESVGTPIFSVALAPADFGAFGDHAFVGQDFTPTGAATILALNLNTRELVPFTTEVPRFYPEDGGILQLAFSEKGWAAPLDPGLANESVLLVSLYRRLESGGAVGGAVHIYDQRGRLIGRLTRGGPLGAAPVPLGPHGLAFDGEALLISNVATGSIIRVTVSDFALLDSNADDIPDVCQDCNNNWIPDPQDIGRGTSDDCNGNELPDECEIDVESTAPGGPFFCTRNCNRDCNESGVPDECEVPQNGAVESAWVGSTGGWDRPPNTDWCLPESPNNNPSASFSVTIAGAGADVTLNVSPTIDRLSLLDGATVRVNDLSGANARTLVVDEGITNTGVFLATDRERLVLDAPFIDQVGACGEGGEIRAVDGVLGPGEENDKSIVEINGALVRGGSVVTVGDHSEIHLIGGAELVDTCIRGVVVPDGQSGRFSGIVTNDDVLAVRGVSINTRLEPVGAQALFAGAGCVRLTHPAFARMGDLKQSFINGPAHHIEGTGIVVGGLANEGMINAQVPNQPMILLPPGGKQNNGRLCASNGGILRISDSVSGTGQLLADGGTIQLRSPDEDPIVVHAKSMEIRGSGIGGGRVEVDPIAHIVLTEDLIIHADSSYGAMAGDPAPNASTLSARNIMLMPTFCGAPVQMLLTDNMSVTATGDFVLDGRGTASCNTSASRTAAILGGRTPPNTKNSGNSAFQVIGNIILLQTVTFSNTSLINVALGGDWDNQCKSPIGFDWLNGGLSLVGTTPQVFEVAGTDVGPSSPGFGDGNHTNFALGILELPAGADVTLTDQFDNDGMGLGDCTEALYTRSLVLHDGSRLTLDRCRLYYLSKIDEGATIVREGCGDLVQLRTGDLDADGDVDLWDFAAFQRCYSDGHSSSGDRCSWTDFNDDDRVNLSDFYLLWSLMAGH